MKLKSSRFGLMHAIGIMLRMAFYSGRFTRLVLVAPQGTILPHVICDENLPPGSGLSR